MEIEIQIISFNLNAILKMILKLLILETNVFLFVFNQEFYKTLDNDCMIHYNDFN